MRVIVTGGSGFLGSLVTRVLVSQGHEPLVVDVVAPASDVPFLRSDVADVQIVGKLASLGADAIVHLAGILGTSETFESPQEAFLVNTIGSVNVLEACLISSAHYFGVETGAPWPNPYALSKRAASSLASGYARFRNVRTTTFRVFNLYGPRSHGAQLLATKAIPVFVSAVRGGEPVPIFGTGLQVMDLMWADDAAEVVVGMLELSPGRGEVIDVGSGLARSVLGVAHLVFAAGGRTPESGDFLFLPPRTGEGEEHPIADTEVIRCAMGFESPDAQDDIVVARLRSVFDSYRASDVHPWPR
jgi:UDP-glucose 4-epimerase